MERKSERERARQGGGRERHTHIERELYIEEIFRNGR